MINARNTRVSILGESVQDQAPGCVFVCLLRRNVGECLVVDGGAATRGGISGTETNEAKRGRVAPRPPAKSEPAARGRQVSFHCGVVAGCDLPRWAICVCANAGERAGSVINACNASA